MAESPAATPVTGRTAYDFAAELIQVLGRLTPLFVLLAMFFYSLVQISGSYQAAQVAATERHAKSVEALNALLSNSFGALENVRKSQLDNLEKITTFSGAVAEAVLKSQDAASKARDQLFEAQKKQQEASAALDQAKREEQKLQADNETLRKERWAAESTIDAATRIVAFLTESREMYADVRYLSRRYEGTADGGMSRDKAGNTFYGTYRIPGNEMTSFIQFIARDYAELAARLNDVGGQKAAMQGDEAFRMEWQSLSRNPTFSAAQDQFAETVYYGRFVEQLKRAFPARGGAPGFDPGARSVAFQAVLFSVAVQHGVSSPIARRALDGVDLKAADDATLIKAIYKERRNVDFASESDLTRRLLAIRYRFEEEEALKMLEPTGGRKP